MALLKIETENGDMLLRVGQRLINQSIDQKIPEFPKPVAGNLAFFLHPPDFQRYTQLHDDTAELFQSSIERLKENEVAIDIGETDKLVSFTSSMRRGISYTPSV